MDLTETTVETDESFESDLSDDEYADAKIKAKKPQEHKDEHGRRCALISFDLPHVLEGNLLNQ
eukprot:CAMPEP_0204896524 /NCGR_PEP_ID=MMETSP1397-20131031/212_1 /ASSEMBLY_ACC=CAM_ASM_000891 /TAXON_ID=49980 /ORGANISM="Climacostomum Climacostomum virens, Strain Stock W-24" /LENGTH=62 /DNA_ID=CAMNT_0052064143 /DNA_START=1034 /DNA_END=1222 /DNA_ORIENTATION=+